MMPLRVCAVVVGLLGASTCDALAPLVIPAVGVVILGVMLLVSRRMRRQRSIARIARRLAMYQSQREPAASAGSPLVVPEEPLELFSDPRFVEPTWQVTPVPAAPPAPVKMPEPAPQSAEADHSGVVVALDHYRNRTRKLTEQAAVEIAMNETATQESAAVAAERVLQRRLADRVDALRLRRPGWTAEGNTEDRGQS